MKRFLLMLLLATGVYSSQAQRKAPAPVKKPVVAKAPQVAKLPAILKVSAKDVRQMIDTSTGPMIFNFWATWCGPCIREIPWFESVIAQSGAPVQLVLVSLDFPEAYTKTLPAFLKEKGYKAKVVYLNETSADTFIPIIDKKWQGAIPASIFVNNSKQYYQLYNQQLTEKGFELELKKLL